MNKSNTKDKVFLMSISTLLMNMFTLLCTLTLMSALAPPLTTHASESKLPSRFIGVFDYTYKDGVGHFTDNNRDYVVLYELRVSTFEKASIKLDSPVYTKLYIYPVTKASFQKYMSSNKQDPSVLKMVDTTYTFNKPSSKIYPKPSDGVISTDKTAFNFEKNIVKYLQGFVDYGYDHVPKILLRNVYLKEGLTAIPDSFLHKYKKPNIHTLTSNNLEDSKEGLPDSIESIGKFAFARTWINFNSLPSNLKDAGECAFEYCILKTKELPDNAVFHKDAMRDAFVVDLKHLDMDKHFPNGIENTKFGSDVISKETLTVKVNELCSNLFTRCSFYDNIKLVTNSKVMPSHCFLNCHKVKIDSISKNVVEIDKEAFKLCSSVLYKDTNRLKKLFENVENASPQQPSWF